MSPSSGRLSDPDVLRSRIAGASNLPSPPAVAARLIDVADSSNLTMTMVVEILRTDPALSAKLLRLANSPLYARRRRIDTLQQAVTLLGLDAVLTAALSLTLLNDGAIGSVGFKAQWTRSVHSAVAAQAIAQHLRGVQPADAFLSGLLQDIGVLVITRLEPETYAELGGVGVHAELVAAELVHLPFDHAEIGAELLAAWNLPEHIVGAVRESHHAPVAGASLLNSVVAVSGWVADAIAGDGEAMQVAAEAVEMLGLDRAEFALVVDEVAAALPELASLLQATVPPADRLAELASEVIMGRLINAHAAADQLRRELEAAADSAEALELENRIDSLTGLLTRRALDRALAEHGEQWTKFRWPMAVLFVDVDHFKRVNDTHGHQIGDEALRMVAARVAGQLRNGDIIGRYGGDEMVVILPAATVDGAVIVAERLLDAMRAAPLVFANGESHRQTLSIGVAATEGLPMGGTLADLLAAADAAVYDAKRSGRDRLCTMRREALVSPASA